ncbi:hypothetical protein [Leptolyngbya sp. NIES-2104]|uniref:hypothetical protein n=1 Tax=Leptolyngbya sp. NIES-2104 TaxID=1552121 RepID=UPI0006EC5100|nr:hypothetical protein [Leptolyngbya sp. NIES-2104]GAP98479.1 hypothetical protein NIES2104_50340 [Leptolyngbya sp. NIES-2104]
MTIALFLTVIAAIAGAISAAARTYTKLKPQPQSFKTVQEAKSQEADQPRLQPDLDSERSEPVEAPVQSPEVSMGSPVSEQESIEASHPQKASEVSTIAVPPMMPIAEPEISLATSLRISDVVDSDLLIESKPEAHHAYSVIDEVGQLDHFDDRLRQLQHQATDSDHLVRLSVAVELGELAKQGQAIDQVVALLNQLTQDADLEVRVQAGTALAMVSVETTSD